MPSIGPSQRHTMRSAGPGGRPSSSAGHCWTRLQPYALRGRVTLSSRCVDAGITSPCCSHHRRRNTL